MKAYKKKEIVLASAITVSCVAFTVLYHTLFRGRGENGGGSTDIIYEEDTGDSYEI